jgi:hypothetical protein
MEDHGWLNHPVVFKLGLNNSTPFKQTMRCLANEDVERQEQLGTNLTPVRLVGDNWFEYDVGEINIMDSGENANFSFIMEEVNVDNGLGWKRELLVDGVVLRPTSLAKTIGESLSIGELAERHKNFVNQGLPVKQNRLNGKNKMANFVKQVLPVKQNRYKGKNKM